MEARFVLGPAGTGKTYLCLQEIREALIAQPQGAPLILLAPKQATFQLERQLLHDPALPGYTRLHILSFERLAEFILERRGTPLPALLSDDGRTMVLRALLTQRRNHLKVFHASAGLSGFARQLSLELRELQRQQLTPVQLANLALRPELAEPLRRKLHDLSLLLADYLAWLQKNNLQDADCLLDLAVAALPVPDGTSPAFIAGLWLDGFADMTPQELTLLAALAPFCEKLTLAFCLDRSQTGVTTSWLSMWSGLNQSWRRCHHRLRAVPGATISMVDLPRRPAANRFVDSPALAHLEENWMQPKDFPNDPAGSLRVALCASPAEEALLAVREILSFVRAGGRFREAAVLVRQLDGYHDDLRRVFDRCEIPFFLDRRQAVAQHPLAELTRSALRAAAGGWGHSDWFGALKTGLVSENAEAIDLLENIALAHGWKGDLWFAPLPPEDKNARWAEPLRLKLTAPFAKFRRALGHHEASPPTGAQLAQAIRELWRDLHIEKKLESATEPRAAVDATVWEQMNSWLDDIHLAFANKSLSLPEWLPILETGLAGLTIGVIPPALDQVLIGAVDRSRNPELKLAILLGVNEKVFPATPSGSGLLTESDRGALKQYDLLLGHDTREFLSREQFLGYIACTRSSRRLVVACSQRDQNDQPLNPSSFLSRLKALFSKLEIETFSPPMLAQSPLLTDFAASIPDQLTPELAAQLYGTSLQTSVSRLEQFAACSFQFFIHSGLRAEERKFFELDARERGNFQHAVLALFHQELQNESKRWRDLTPGDARARIGRIVEELAGGFHHGLMTVSAQTRFAARGLAQSLQDFVATLVQWMSHYQFDPIAVELAFGPGDAPLPAWELDLGAGRRLVFRGRIDRIDLHRPAGAETALAVVVDYKSGQRKLDKLMMAHGLQLQLAAYLSVLRNLPDPKQMFGASQLIPAGVFYVNLRGQSDSAKTRAEVLRDRESVRQTRYQHSGRFDFDALQFLDSRKAASGLQFKYRLKNNGEPYANGTDLMSAANFRQMLDQVETQLVRMGREIYEGKIELNPFQKGSERACDKCEYQGICRFDTWTHTFRILAPEKDSPSDPGNSAG